MLSDKMSGYCRKLLSQAIGTALLCFLLVFILSTAVIFANTRQSPQEEWRATVKSDSLSIYSDASTSSKPVGVLQKGDVVIIKLEIVGEGTTWCSIADTKNQAVSGYVKDSGLEREQTPALESWSLQPPPPSLAELELLEEAKAIEEASRAGKVSLNRGSLPFKRNEVKIGVERFFNSRFGRSLPVSAFGQTALHGRLGFNHSNAFDIAVHPDSLEGRAILSLLRAQGIPFIAFRSAVAGIATGPHIHVGNPSPRR